MPIGMPGGMCGSARRIGERLGERLAVPEQGREAMRPVCPAPVRARQLIGKPVQPSRQLHCEGRRKACVVLQRGRGQDRFGRDPSPDFVAARASVRSISQSNS